MKCRRSLGLLLEIESGKLDLFEGDQANFITQVVDEWFKMTPDMSESHRWEELTRVLLEPAVDEPTLAQDFLLRWRRGSTLSTPRSSIASPTDVSLRSEMDYIGIIHD